MFTTKVKIAAVLVLTAGVLTKAEAAPVPAPPKVPKELREKLRDAARRVYVMNLRRYQGGLGSPSDLLGWSERWLDAELALSQEKVDDRGALKAHLDRTREVERIALAYVKAGGARQSDADAATYERINAEIRVFQATGKIPPPPVYDKPVPIPKHLIPIKEQDEDERKEAEKEQKRRLHREKEQPPQDDNRKEAAPAKDRKELLQQRRDIAWRAYQGKLTNILSGEGMPRDLLACAERLLEARLALCDKEEDRLAVLKYHLAYTREAERLAIVYAKTGLGRQADADAATYERLKADIRYFQATGKVPPPPPEVKIKDDGGLPTRKLEIKPDKKDDKP